MNIYVSNIPFKASDSELKELFEEYGEVSSAKIIMDKVSQRSRGFGFVEMPDEDAGRKAIAALNNTELHNRVISVVEAKHKLNHKGSYKVGNGAVEAYRFRKS